MYMLVEFLALLAFLGGFGGKSAQNVECAKGRKIYKESQHAFEFKYLFLHIII